MISKQPERENKINIQIQENLDTERYVYTVYISIIVGYVYEITQHTACVNSEAIQTEI